MKELYIARSISRFLARQIPAGPSKTKRISAIGLMMVIVLGMSSCTITSDPPEMRQEDIADVGTECGLPFQGLFRLGGGKRGETYTRVTRLEDGRYEILTSKSRTFKNPERGLMYFMHLSTSSADERTRATYVGISDRGYYYQMLLDRPENQSSARFSWGVYQVRAKRTGQDQKDAEDAAAKYGLAIEGPGFKISASDYTAPPSDALLLLFRDSGFAKALEVSLSPLTPLEANGNVAQDILHERRRKLLLLPVGLKRGWGNSL